MRLCADIDGVRERLQDGSMTLNAAAQLQNAFDRQERNRDRAARSAPGEDGFGAAARSQDGSAPGPTQPAERKPAPVLDRSARRALVEQAAGKSSRQVMQLLAEVDPEMTAPPDRVRPLGAGRWELKAVIDDECRRGLELLKGLLSHVDPHMTLGQLMGRLVREGLDRHDPARPPRGRRTGSHAAGAEQTSAAKTQAASSAQAAGQPGNEAASPLKAHLGPEHPDTSAAKPAGDTTSAPKQDANADSAAPSAAKVSAQATGQPGDEAASRLQADRCPDTSVPKTRCLGRQAAACAERAAAPPRTQNSAAKAAGATGRSIPAAVKRAVWRRDRGRCSYVDRTSGRCCGSQHLLQIDHVVPYAQGGAAEPNNLRLLCAAHHRHRHAGTGFGRPG